MLLLDILISCLKCMHSILFGMEGGKGGINERDKREARKEVKETEIGYVDKKANARAR